MQGGGGQYIYFNCEINRRTRTARANKTKDAETLHLHVLCRGYRVAGFNSADCVVVISSSVFCILSKGVQRENEIIHVKTMEHVFIYVCERERVYDCLCLLFVCTRFGSVLVNVFVCVYVWIFCRKRADKTKYIQDRFQVKTNRLTEMPCASFKCAASYPFHFYC